MLFARPRSMGFCAPLVYHPLKVPVAGYVVAVDLQQRRGCDHRVVGAADRHPPPVVVDAPPVDHLAHGSLVTVLSGSVTSVRGTLTWRRRRLLGRGSSSRRSEALQIAYPAGLQLWLPHAFTPLRTRYPPCGCGCYNHILR